MRKKWLAMSPAERRRMQGMIIILMLCGYAPLCAFNVSQYHKAVNALNRRNNRMETLANIDNINTDGPSARMVQQRIRKVEQEGLALSDAFAKEEAGFAPIDSSDEQQALQLQISQLADQTHAELLSVAKKRFRGQKGERELDPTTRRPVLNIEAAASYGQFVRFLEGFESLSYHVSVINLKLVASSSENGVSRILITLELSI